MALGATCSWIAAHKNPTANATTTANANANSASKPLAEMGTAHESAVFALDWHPMGHILTSVSNDHTTRFWTRPRPGEGARSREEVRAAAAAAGGYAIRAPPGQEGTATGSNAVGLAGSAARTAITSVLPGLKAPQSLPGLGAKRPDLGNTA